MDQSLKELNEKGFKLIGIGDFKNAKQCIQKAFHLAKTKYGPDHPEYAIILTGCGYYAQRANHDFKEAMRCYEKAEKILLASGWKNTIQYRAVLNNKATIYSSLNNKDKALAIYESLLQINYKPDEIMDYAMSLINAGSLRCQKQQYDTGLNHLKKAKKIFNDTGANNNLDFISSYNGLLNQTGLCYIGQKKYLSAIKEFNTALNILKDFNLEQSSLSLPTLNNLALVYQMKGQMKGDYKTLRGTYTKIIATSNLLFGSNNPDIRDIYDNISGIYIKEKKYQKAVEMLIKSSEILERVYIDQIVGFCDDSEIFEAVEQFRIHEHILLSLLSIWDNIPQNVINEIFNFISRRKSFILDSLTFRNRLLQTKKDKNLTNDLNQLKLIKSEISKMVYTPSKKIKDEIEYKEKIRNLGEKSQKIERKILQTLSFSYFEQIQKIDPSLTIPKNIDHDTVCVEFVKYKKIDFKSHKVSHIAYAAFILTNGSPIKYIDLGNAPKIDRLIWNVIQQCSDPFSSITPQIKKQSEKIIKPFIDEIKQKKHLTVIPDGLFNFLPFSILNNAGKLLNEDLTISYLTSSRDILNDNLINSKELNEPIIIVDPDFGLAGNIEKQDYGEWNSKDFQTVLDLLPIYERVEETETEGKKIHEIIGGELWLGKDALKSKLKLIESPKILHIATHGYFLPDHSDTKKRVDPLLRSGLLLAGVNSFRSGQPLLPEAENGIMTAYEISELNLTGTELVVASACETGIGDVLSGEGVFGFRRAFAIAGARSIITTLWRVDDRATRDFMIQFYSLLQTGKTKLEAFNEAQLRIKEKFPHPYYWGAFILQGDCGLIQSKISEKKTP